MAPLYGLQTAFSSRNAAMADDAVGPPISRLRVARRTLT